MAKSGVYRRYRGSRRRVGFWVPALIVLCVLAAATLIYINFNLEDAGDGTMVLHLPFTNRTITFGEPNVEFIVEEPEDVVVEVVLTDYEKRIVQPAFITFDENFDQALASLTGVNTVVLKFTYDSGNMISDEDAISAHEKIVAAGLNPCAQISCFRNDAYARENQAVACVKEDGTLWMDGNEYAWLNPYKDEAADYVCTVIEKAYALGYREILLTNVAFPVGDVFYSEEMEKGAAVSAFLDKVNTICAQKGDLNVAIYFDGKESTLNGQELDAIVSNFYRIYTRDPDIYNKVGTLIPAENQARRIVSIAN